MRRLTNSATPASATAATVAIRTSPSNRTEPRRAVIASLRERDGRKMVSEVYSTFPRPGQPAGPRTRPPYLSMLQHFQATVATLLQRVEHQPAEQFRIEIGRFRRHLFEAAGDLF